MATNNTADVLIRIQNTRSVYHLMLQKLGNASSPLDEKKGEARVFKDDVAELVTATKAIVLRLEDRQRREGGIPPALQPWTKVHTLLQQIKEKLIRLGDCSSGETFNARVPSLSQDVRELHDIAQLKGNELRA